MGRVGGEDVDGGEVDEGVLGEAVGAYAGGYEVEVAECFEGLRCEYWCHCEKSVSTGTG